MDIHKTQEKLLNLLADNMDSPLTMRELQEKLDLSSPSFTSVHLKKEIVL